MRSLFLLLLVFIVIKPSFAQDNSENMADSSQNSPHFTIDYDLWKNKKEIKQTKSGRIDQIIDGLTFTLKDGTIIRLASIDIPDRYDRQENLYEQAAMQKLKELLPERTEVHLFQPRQANNGRENRMGHQLAHIVTKEDHIWIQGELLQTGLVNAYPLPGNDELLTEILSAEEKALKKQIGIWTINGPYALKSTAYLNQSIGDFVVVDATAKKVATVRNNIYLNFGNDWKKDFTVMINPDQRKALARQAIDPLSLANKPLRIRGWLREYNGPFIELEDIAHLQLLSPDQILPKPDQVSNLSPEETE